MKVVNIKNTWYDTYIGRGSKWGNPFKIGVDGNRQQVIAKYEQYITTGKGQHLLLHLNELKNCERLGCHCKPEACHGDVLIRLIEDYERGKLF